MDFTQAIILALVQGITEFLPISSSAHLILLPRLLNWPDQGIVFDVAVHLGTLTAVVFHYRHLLPADRLRRQLPAQHHPLWLIAVASIPVFVAGYLFESVITHELRTPLIIATTTIVFALLLWFADYRHTGSRQSLNLSSALLIGIAQALALVPGTSRAGITLTAGLLLGLSRTYATHFAFLLAIPVIAAAALYEGIKITAVPQPDLWPLLALGFGVSAGVALATIRLFLKLVEIIGLLPFVVYRLLLGGLLLFLFN